METRPYKQSGSRKTVLLLHKNVKLVIKYAHLYGVTLCQDLGSSDSLSKSHRMISSFAEKKNLVLK